jgi:hypothetical protein
MHLAKWSPIVENNFHCCPSANADETTAIGEPKPGLQGRVQYQPRTINQGTSLLGLVGVGAGIGLVFAVLGRLL